MASAQPPPSPPPPLSAVTVTGPADLDQTEDLLAHEHLLYDLTSRYCTPTTIDLAAIRDEEPTLGRLAVLRQHARYNLASLRAPPRETVAAEVRALRGGRPAHACAVVDATVGSSRNLAGLLALSEATGVSIIASAGFSLDEAARSMEVDDEEGDGGRDELVERLIRELMEGVPVPGQAAPVRCGLLCAGEIPVLAEVARMSMEAARARDVAMRTLGRAHTRTLAPVLMALPAPPYLEPGAEGAGAEGYCRAAVDSAQAMISVHGVKAGSLLIAHAQNLLLAGSTGRTALDSLCSLGVGLCFDGFGDSWEVAGCPVDAEEADSMGLPPSDELVSRAVASLANGGHSSQVFLSHAISSRLHLSAYGGGGLRHIRERLLPRLRRAGVADEATLRMLCAGNAARLLAWWEPAGPAPRVCKAWTCRGCQRTFEEAVNPAEALPTDQIYYDKFDRRYCSMHCLSCHRKANFPEPFACAPPP